MTIRHARRRARRVAMSLLPMMILLAQVGTAIAASPSPSEAPGGDPRSPGQGPGLVGDPLQAIVAVVLIGLLAVVLTYAWIKLTDRRRA